MYFVKSENCLFYTELRIIWRVAGVVSACINAFSGSHSQDKVSNLVQEAQELYPNKVGTELHHITPQYLGGPASGETVELDAAYHQVITNEFRSLYGYGQSVPPPEQVEAIKNQVYSAYPLP